MFWIKLVSRYLLFEKYKEHMFEKLYSGNNIDIGTDVINYA